MSTELVGSIGLVLLVGGALVGITVMIGLDDGFWAGAGFLVTVHGATALLMLLSGMASGEIG